MGAWGTGIFDSDSALDAVIEILETDDLSLVEQFIREVVEYQDAEDDYVDAFIAEYGLAAAEVVAALSGKPGDLPDDLQEWLEGKDTPSPELRKLAHTAVSIALNDSELQELWEDADESDYTAWQAGVNDLLARLSD